jgi:hypothetical protein
MIPGLDPDGPSHCCRLGSRLREGLDREHTDGMTARDDFRAWVESALYAAELSLPNGDFPRAVRSGPVTSP